jgi:hypothetical protein
VEALADLFGGVDGRDTQRQDGERQQADTDPAENGERRELVVDSATADAARRIALCRLPFHRSPALLRSPDHHLAFPDNVGLRIQGQKEASVPPSLLQ